MITMRPTHAAVIFGLSATLVLTSCSGSDGEESQPRSTEPPSAPEQHLPDVAEEHTDSTEDVPVSELADTDWVASTGEEHQIPQRALEAYAGAAIRMDELHPECNLGWNTLAGIGSIETAHSSIHDSGLDAQGVAEPEIIGPELDGSGDFGEVEDTDEGEYDGDEIYDRAVGPMQFLPETWQSYAVDGNKDGETDPQQIDDAALTSAVYLCTGTDDIREDDDWVSAVTRYNQSMIYAQDVARVAESYGPGEDDSEE